MDESGGELSHQQQQQQQGESPSSAKLVQSTTNSPSRLAALRRADDIVLHGGYASPSGRSSPTHLLQRSNSIRQTAGVRSPPSSRSGTSSLPQSPISRSPRGPSTPDAASEYNSPRVRTYTRSGTSISSRKGVGLGGGGRWSTFLSKRSGTLCFLLLLFCFGVDWWYLSTLRPRIASSPPEKWVSQPVHQDGPKHQPSPTTYDRLLALATHGLAEVMRKS